MIWAWVNVETMPHKYFTLGVWIHILRVTMLLLLSAIVYSMIVLIQMRILVDSYSLVHDTISNRALLLPNYDFRVMNMRALQTDASSSNKLKVGAIVGLAIGGVVVLVVLVGVAFALKRVYDSRMSDE
jgi:hypothetical protein